METNDLLRRLNSCNVAIAGRSFDVKIALFLETKPLFLFISYLYVSAFYSLSRVTLRWLLRSYVHLKTFYSLWDYRMHIWEPVEEKTNEAAKNDRWRLNMVYCKGKSARSTSHRF